MKVLASVFVLALAVAAFGFSSTNQQAGKSMLASNLPHAKFNVEGDK